MSTFRTTGNYCPGGSRAESLIMRCPRDSRPTEIAKLRYSFCQTSQSVCNTCDTLQHLTTPYKYEGTSFQYCTLRTSVLALRVLVRGCNSHVIQPRISPYEYGGTRDTQRGDKTLSDIVDCLQPVPDRLIFYVRGRWPEMKVDWEVLSGGDLTSKLLQN